MSPSPSSLTSPGLEEGVPPEVPDEKKGSKDGKEEVVATVNGSQSLQLEPLKISNGHIAAGDVSQVGRKIHLLSLILVVQIISG